MSWQALEDGNQELAESGLKRFATNHVAYMATIRRDGSPRGHPMTPIVGQGRLFFFTDPPDLKGRDLQRRACSVVRNTQQPSSWHSSLAMKLSHRILSQQSPSEPVEGKMPAFFAHAV